MRRLDVVAAERHGFVSRQMGDGINPYDIREADCSGRALATLVIAWVGAALVASVLLQWTHMWVALAVLTLLFLAACGYAACDARRTHERALAREEERQLERRRRREHQLASVSGGIDNFPEIIDPPEYQTYWGSDLPPSYNAIICTQTGNSGVPPPSETTNVEEVQLDSRRLSNPPPYAIAIQSEPLFLPIQNANQTGESQPTLHGLSQIVTGQNVILQSVEGGQTSSESESNLNPQNVQTPRLLTVLPPVMRDEDKVGEGPENGLNNATTTPTRTQYLASIINSTFGRTMRRTNNTEQNVTPGNGQTENQNNRNRADQSFVNNSTNNNNRNNNNNNNVPEPPPQYPSPPFSGIFSDC